MEAQHSSRTHALLSASHAERWLNCTPSARMEEKFQDTAPSQYAEEGTLAHEIAETALRARFRLSPVDDCTKEIRRLKKSELYSKEMDDYLATYLNYVTDSYTKSLQQTPDAAVLLEQRLDFSDWVPEGSGIGDAVVISDGTLHVIDLKYGQGVAVFAKDNPQLMLYGLGALKRFEMAYDLTKVKMTIVQPRQERVDSFEMDLEPLRKWGEDVVRPAAMLAYRGEGAAKCGPWCKFCKVKAVCGCLAYANLDLAKDEFKDPALLSDERLAEIFGQIPMLKDWAEAVSEYLLRQALAGKEIPGYKVVEGRSVRKWSDEDAVREILSVDYKPEEYLTTKLIGIPAAEKLLKKDFAPLLGGFVVTPQGSPTLVPLSDKRPSMIGVQQAQNDFNEKID